MCLSGYMAYYIQADIVFSFYNVQFTVSMVIAISFDSQEVIDISRNQLYEYSYSQD